VERVVRVFKSFEEAEKADREFYDRLTPQQRVDLMLELMEQYRSQFYGASERLERVYRIVKLPQR
jgi:hypothetical protein